MGFQWVETVSVGHHLLRLERTTIYPKTKQLVEHHPVHQLGVASKHVLFHGVLFLQFGVPSHVPFGVWFGFPLSRRFRGG